MWLENEKKQSISLDIDRVGPLLTGLLKTDLRLEDNLAR